MFTYLNLKPTLISEFATERNGDISRKTLTLETEDQDQQSLISDEHSRHTCWTLKHAFKKCQCYKTYLYYSYEKQQSLIKVTQPENSINVQKEQSDPKD